ncbi:hypothetical protein LX16_4234 [Stackebrandtia albiflava]|uniref:Uncharacterized protein n=1 Tax=Stackebrandtia albiflava TaxID=406432 RepID=A0A562UYU5_9ACTN|nr:hypothetical protein [Stackebrandtia albiflava]TWJ10810.1 hypothetical protein LX16_4234 [Stackebrandtia albiflava]
MTDLATRMPGEPPVARLRVHNDAEEPLELSVEPWGSDHWLHPGETALVWTVGSTDAESPWSGTTHGDEPFEVSHHGRGIQVHCNGVRAHVTDPDGVVLECGHQRPETPAR